MLTYRWRDAPGSDGLPKPFAGPHAPPLSALRRLGTFFAAEMDAGRLARREPAVFASAFIGPIVHWVLLETIARARHEAIVAPDRFVRGLIELFVDSPATPVRTRRRKPQPTARSKPAPK